MNQFFRYILVGVMNSAVGYSVIFGCMYLAGLSPEASNIVGYAVALVVSYLLNRHYTFNSTQKRRSEITRFLAVFAVAYGLNFLALLALVYRLGVHEGASQIIAGVVYVAFSYLMNKYYVFRRREPA
ncbi:MAG TPA: GtrA family protein [Paucimonas sp.]|nr:GtrA family protein [Paucimonas sp.]